MNCNICDSNIEATDEFCRKCGARLTDSNLNAQSVTSNAQADLLKSNDENSMSISRKYKKTILIWMSVCFLLVIIVIIFIMIKNQNVKSTIDRAISLYNNGMYSEAYDLVKDFPNSYKNDDWHKNILFAENIYIYKQFALPIYSDNVADASFLITGLSKCINLEMEETSVEQDKLISELKQMYLDDLKANFGISELKALELKNYPVDLRESELEKIISTGSGGTGVDFKISDLDWDSNSSYKVAVGTVKNTGSVTIYFVQLKVSFKDSSELVIDTDSTYAVGSEGLEPGESTKWKSSVEFDENIVGYTVSVIGYKT